MAQQLINIGTSANDGTGEAIARPLFDKINDNFGELYAGGAEIRIAASDTPAALAATAQYVCDGTADEVQINAAIAALPTTGTDILGHNENTYPNNGGCIRLLPGTFSISAPITNTTKHNFKFCGSGPASVIKNDQTNQGHAFTITGTALTNGINGVHLEGFTVIGNYTDATTRSGDGVRVVDVHHMTIRDVRALGNGGNGISILATTEGKGADDKTISGVYCLYNHGSGMYLDNLHDMLINGSHFEENDVYGLHVERNVGLYLSNCNLEDNYGAYELFVDELQLPIMSGCIIEGDVLFQPTVSRRDLNMTGCWMGSMTITSDDDFALYISSCRFHNVILNGAGKHEIYVTASRIQNVLQINTTNAGWIASLSACFTNLVQVPLSAGDGNISIVGGEVGFTNTAVGKLLVDSATRVQFVGGTSVWVRELIVKGTSVWVGDATFRSNGANTYFMLANNIIHNTAVSFISTSTDARLTLSGNDLRTVTIDTDSVGIVFAQGNMISTGTMTLDNTDNQICFIGNFFWNNATVVIESTCAATPRFVGNEMTSFTLTNNGVTEELVGNNT